MASLVKADPATVADLHKWFRYDPATGLLYRRAATLKNPANTPIGDSGSGGYIHVKINRQNRGAHRIIWAMHYGEWPKTELDHINRDRSDNRLSNLRIATRSLNAAHGIKRNKFGYRGVSRCRKGGTKKWQAWIGVRNKLGYLGSYATLEEAARAYDAAAKSRYGEFAVLNFPD